MTDGVYLFTGDRDWTNRVMVAAHVANIALTSPNAVVVSGGARGLDLMVWEIARDAGLRNVRIDAPWHAYGKRAGPVRNQWMLDIALALAPAYGPVHVEAYHNNIAQSKGTLDMVGRCKDAGLHVTIHCE